MKKLTKLLLIFFTITNIVAFDSIATARIKDIVNFEGIRDNLLVGYGLVVGLNGTGDNLTNAAFTQKGLTDFLEKLGVNTKGANLKTKNLAAVMVTATLPAFSRQGSKIDVAVSTLGDAKSLQGGTLLATPLLGADGEVYAVSQGQVSIPGFSAIGKSGTTTSRGVATNGFISSGAIIEKEIDFNLNSLTSIKLGLKNPDITTSKRISDIINYKTGGDIAKALDPGTVELSVPAYQGHNVVDLLALIENMEVEPDQVAKIIVDESSGTIVIGENVKVSSVAISQGNLTIVITEKAELPPIDPFNPPAQPQTPPNIYIDQDRGKKLHMLSENATLKDLVDGLNALGVGPRDLITILQNIKAAGALQAEIEVR